MWIAASLSLGCAVSLFYLARFAAPPLREASAMSPHLWQDEGYAWNGVRKLRDAGYSGFRCRQDAPMPCYGLTQAAIDLGLIHTGRLFIGDERMNESALMALPHEPNSAAWFFRVDQPWDAWVLRVSRVVFALLLMVGLGGWLARNLDVSRSERFAWALIFAGALSLLPTFMWARQGIKNDFPAALALLGALILYLRHHTVGAFLILGASLGIRFGNAPVLAVLLAHQTWLLVRGGAVRSYLWALLAAAVSILVAHPHLWVSSSEFGSFLSLPGATQTRLDWSKIAAEFWAHALPNVAVFLVLTFVLTQRDRLLERLSKPQFWLALAAICLIALNLRNGLGRSAYYITPVVLLTFCMGSVGLRTRSRAFMLLALLVLSLARFEESRPRVALAAIQAKAPSRIESLQLDETSKWVAIDQKLRLSPSASDPVQVFEFDSTRDSPELLLGRLSQEELAGEIVVTCWGGTNGPYDERTWSLSLEQWARVVSPLCNEVEQPSRGLIESYENGSRPVKRVHLKLADLKARWNEIRRASTWVSHWPERANVTLVSPLFFRGAEAGIDLWFAPLALGRDATLMLDLKDLARVSTPVRTVRIKGETTCKSDAELSLWIDAQPETALKDQSGKKIASLPLRSGETHCARFPSFCKRLTVRGPFSFEAPLPKGSRSLSIILSGLDLDYCRVFLQPIEFLK
jgi:hypothetical protein